MNAGRVGGIIKVRSCAVSVISMMLIAAQQVENVSDAISINHNWSVSFLPGLSLLNIP